MIKNLILDMGGVILDVDYNKILDSFALYKIDAKKIYTQTNQMEFISLYEKGLISSQEFINHIREITLTTLTDKEIIDIWNSMILSVRIPTIELIGKLKSKYQNIFLFSNTNDIHMQYVTNYFQQQLGFDIFTLLFSKSYLSNQIHLRKPDIQAFEYIISDSNIKPEESLFIDDTEQNIIGARQSGLHAYLLSPNETLLDLEQNHLI